MAATEGLRDLLHRKPFGLGKVEGLYDTHPVARIDLETGRIFNPDEVHAASIIGERGVSDSQLEVTYVSEKASVTLLFSRATDAEIEAGWLAGQVHHHNQRQTCDTVGLPNTIKHTGFHQRRIKFFIDDNRPFIVSKRPFIFIACNKNFHRRRIKHIITDKSFDRLAIQGSIG